MNTTDRVTDFKYIPIYGYQIMGGNTTTSTVYTKPVIVGYTTKRK